MTAASYSSDKRQNNDDDEHQSESTAWVITPTVTIRPRRQCADQQQNQNNNQNSREHDTFPRSLANRNKNVSVRQKFLLKVPCDSPSCIAALQPRIRLKTYLRCRHDQMRRPDGKRRSV